MKTNAIAALAVLLGTLLSSPSFAQVPDDFPIPDRFSVGASIGVSKNAAMPSPHNSPDFSARVDIPARVGSRVRVEIGRVRWMYDHSVPPARSRPEPVVIRRGTLSLVRTFLKPVESSKVGTYAGFGWGVYQFSGKSRSYVGSRPADARWTGGGFQGLAGIEYVTPDHKRSLSFDALLYVTGARTAALVPAGLPSGALAGNLSIGFNRRF